MHSVEASERFVEHCRSGKRLSDHTLRAYRADLRDFSSHLGGQVDVVDVDRHQLSNYARQLFLQKLKESTVKRRLATLRAFFRWLEREELIPLTPFHRFDLAVRQPHRLPRTLSADEMRALLRRSKSEATSQRHEALMLRFVIVALFTTGLRVGEISEVELRDVFPEEGVVQVRGKGNRERRVYLPGQEANTDLMRYLSSRHDIQGTSPRLLVNANGNAIGTQYIRRRLRSLAKRAKIQRPVTPHMLRHTAATQLIEAGVDIRFVQKLLGHASISTTQIYTHVSDSSLKATLERADTLGRLSVIAT